jgi:heavy metal sensor kinase
MFKSIRWRLHLWYALILLAVIAGFGAASYIQIRQARLDEIDADLTAAARLLEGSLRGVPGEELTAESLPNPPPGDPWPPPVKKKKKHDGPPPPLHEFQGPRHAPVEPDHGPPLPEAMRNSGPPWRRRLDVASTFRQGSRDARQPFFIIWNRDAAVVAVSALPEEHSWDWENAFEPYDAAPVLLTRAALRLAIVRGPHGTRILVGQSIASELADLRLIGWRIAGYGLATWLLGLLGGWFLSRRVLKPIEVITATAAEISARNLAKRIDLGETESELGQLAGVLNDTFARLDAAFDQQVQFTADASHELRTPLSVLLSHIELALGRPRTLEEYQETLQTCQRAAFRMRSLVESLLTLARLDSGQLPLNCRPMDLADVAQDSLDMLRPLAEAKHLRLTAHLTPVPIRGDADRLNQVLLNLLTNAIKYNREGGVVEVSLRVEDDHALVSIADTGVGIAAGDVPHLGERFFRVDKSRSGTRGHGLGLAICRSIVHAHGGTIQIESRPQEGSTFTLRLPRGGPQSPN